MKNRRYFRCIKAFPLDRYDEDGFTVWGDPFIVEPGMLFVQSERPLFVAVAPAVRLEGDDSLWIEIHPDTLALHFEEVDSP